MRVELLTGRGCPHAGQARALLRACLAELAPDEPIHDRVGRYPSPTILIDGIDVMSRLRPEAVEQCRLDVPTRERIVDALRAAGRGGHHDHQ